MKVITEKATNPPVIPVIAIGGGCRAIFVTAKRWHRNWPSHESISEEVAQRLPFRKGEGIRSGSGRGGRSDPEIAVCVFFRISVGSKTRDGERFRFVGYNDGMDADRGSKIPFDINRVVEHIRAAVQPYPPAAMFQLFDEGFTTPFEQLIACIISIVQNLQAICKYRAR